jgi:transmembrane sensor
MEPIYSDMTPQDAQSLLQRYLAGNCTEGERQMLESWYAELAAEFPWEVPAGEATAIHDRMLSRIKTELGGELGEAREEEREKKGAVRRLPWRRYVGVAAAVLVLAGGGWFWWSQHHVQMVNEYPPITIEANPGGDRAVLTLGNGKKVVLDSAANGMLAVEGNGRVVKKNGELDYRQEAEDGAKGAGDNGKSATAFNTLTTPRGGQYKLVLPDGTQVWLDAASSITYPIAFSGKKRQVSITGQAYFEVMHDSRQPFEVDVQGQAVRDVGTAFNINAYSDEPAMKITLASGAAAVGEAGVEGAASGRGGHGDGGHEIVLKQPAQQAEYKNGQLQLAPDADLAAVLAWKNGRFYLTSADIATVMRQISRWYDIDVVFEKGIPGGHITGEVPRNTMLSTTLQVLQTSGVHFRTEGKTIYVTP